MGQWYFRRYIKELPNPGEIVFFDRSWYNRAVVEPVMKFCTEQEYRQFMMQVPEFEHMLNEDGLYIIKFWFSVSKEEQKKRFDARLESPLKRWKYSPIDEKGQELWDRYTKFKERMFAETHTSFCPWVIVKANNKRPRSARKHSLRALSLRLPWPRRCTNAGVGRTPMWFGATTASWSKSMSDTHDILRLSEEDLAVLNTRVGHRLLFSRQKVDPARVLREARYEQRLRELQVKLVQLQTWIIEQRERACVLFEGRDAAGKGGAIRRITSRINPRHYRVVALDKPTVDERGEWYFQRYVRRSSTAG